MIFAKLHLILAFRISLSEERMKPTNWIHSLKPLTPIVIVALGARILAFDSFLPLKMRLFLFPSEVKEKVKLGMGIS